MRLSCFLLLLSSLFSSAQVELGVYDPSISEYKDLVTELGKVIDLGLNAKKKNGTWDIAILRDSGRQETLTRFIWKLRSAISMDDVPAIELSKHGINLIGGSYQFIKSEHPELLTSFDFVNPYFYSLKDHEKANLKSLGLTDQDFSLIEDFQSKNPYRSKIVNAVADWSLANAEKIKETVRTEGASRAYISTGYAWHQIKSQVEVKMANDFLDLFEPEKQNALIVYSTKYLGSKGWGTLGNDEDASVRFKEDVLSGRYFDVMREMKASTEEKSINRDGEDKKGNNGVRKNEN